jgi:hypothetical protein
VKGVVGEKAAMSSKISQCTCMQRTQVRGGQEGLSVGDCLGCAMLATGSGRRGGVPGPKVSSGCFVGLEAAAENMQSGALHDAMYLAPS